MPALELEGLRRSFGEVAAVAGVDLTLPLGSCLGLLGPNGAGKSTLLAMTTGLVRPDAGSVRVAGIDLWREPATAKRRLGVVPEGLRLFERLTIAEQVSYHGLLRGLEQEVAAERTAELLEVLGLQGAAGRLVGDASHGMRRKTALAAALIHSPSVLVLDEPFEGTDPVSARTIRSMLALHAERGGGVLLATHRVEIVQQVCDRVAVMHEGLIRAAGGIEDLTGGRSLEQLFADVVDEGPSGEGGLPWLAPSSP